MKYYDYEIVAVYVLKLTSHVIIPSTDKCDLIPIDQTLRANVNNITILQIFPFFYISFMVEAPSVVFTQLAVFIK